MNCNAFTNSLLDYSGADLNRKKNMKGFDLGIDIKIDKLFFESKGNYIYNKLLNDIVNKKLWKQKRIY